MKIDFITIIATIFVVGMGVFVFCIENGIEFRKKKDDDTENDAVDESDRRQDEKKN